MGANLGGLALAAARIVGVGGRIVCFEPVPANFMRLTGTLARQIPVDTHVILEERAVGAESGEIDIFLNFWDGLHTTEPGVNQGGQTGKIRVEQVTLDEALAYHRIQAVDMLKIDVEGAEAAGAHRRAPVAGRQPRNSCGDPRNVQREEPGKADNARLITEAPGRLGVRRPSGRPGWPVRLGFSGPAARPAGCLVSETAISRQRFAHKKARGISRQIPVSSAAERRPDDPSVVSAVLVSHPHVAAFAVGIAEALAQEKKLSAFFTGVAFAHGGRRVRARGGGRLRPGAPFCATAS